jgi:hypothetical protein
MSQRFVSTASRDGLPKKHLRDGSNVFTISGFGERRSVLKRILIVADHCAAQRNHPELAGAIGRRVAGGGHHGLAIFEAGDVDLPFRRPFQPAKGWRPPFCPARRPGGWETARKHRCRLRAD